MASDNFLSRYDLAGLGAEISIFKNLEITPAVAAIYVMLQKYGYVNSSYPTI